MTTIGFIGTGNMGGAIARTAYKSQKADRILLADTILEKAEALAREISAEVTDNITIAREADYVILAVKPQMLETVMNQIIEALTSRTTRCVVISMLAGKSLSVITEATGNLPVIRIMPNIPVTTGNGIIVYAANDKVSQQETEWFRELMQPAGLVEEIQDNLIDVASGIMGCGPAFAAMFVEALADGGVSCGLPRDKAIRYAAQMMKGTADLLLQSGQHPGQLKDAVCSPAGSTIQGVRVLEENGFRGSVMDAVIATVEKKF